MTGMGGDESSSKHTPRPYRAKIALAFGVTVRSVHVNAETTPPELWRDAERRRLVRLCAAITGDAAAAEDLAQETLLEAWRNAHKLHDTAGADRWLSAIARNVCRRWARRRGRDLAIAPLTEDVPAGVEVDLERAELAELLDGALAQLPAATRDVLVARFVHDSPHAEIAERLGLSEDAVSMRISRGRVVLRRMLADHLDAEPHDGWRETRVWCTECGRRKLVMRREAAPDALVFRCPGCAPDGEPGSVLRYDNPLFARILEDVVRPAAILRRVAEWTGPYFDTRGDDAACTRCGGRVRIRPYDRGPHWRSVHRTGLVAECAKCGQNATSSLAAIALAQPRVREFRREHARMRLLPIRDVTYDGIDAILVRHEDLLGSAGVDVFFARHTLRVVAVA
jgi:RNA polymerase sigma-70 factor (ECF subfamily)